LRFLSQAITRLSQRIHLDALLTTPEIGMAQTDTTDIRDRMIALLEEAQQTGYRRGWEDAVRNIMNAATTAAPNAPSQSPALGKRDAPTEASSHPETGKMRRISNRAPWGLSIRAVDLALNRAGDQGVDFDMVRAIARETENHDLAESSVRSTLTDKAANGEVERRNGRWFRIARPQRETAEPTPQADSAASVTSYQGGQNERTALVQ
jgi:hypothetical protein